MTTIVTILTEGFADWETTLLNAVAKGFYGAEAHYATPGGKPVTSTGGMKITPDMKLEDLDPSKLDALIVCGGAAWQKPGAPDLTELLQKTKAAGKIIGAICDGTVAAAKTGVLDDVAHTSNGVGYLDKTGYQGKANYKDVPHAIVDGNIVTAGATAPVSFAKEVMHAAGIGDEQLDYYLGLHAKQYAKAA
jgi:putative intracellular protease/amidase